MLRKSVSFRLHLPYLLFLRERTLSLVNGFATNEKRLCSLGKNDYSLGNCLNLRGLIWFILLIYSRLCVYVQEKKGGEHKFIKQQETGVEFSYQQNRTADIGLVTI